ncbi:MAG: hypothetical protein MUF29_09030, partial [Chitinophagaceae bacterium]|nr:hypothetical protein [Chitinophagaceae bacterium]
MKKHLPLFWLALLLVLGCSVSKAPVKKFLSAEDEAVLELLDQLRKTPDDKTVLNLLPEYYSRAMNSRAAMKDYVLRDNPAGDRWVLWRRQLEASQSITDAVMSFPPAAALITQPVYFTRDIADARNQAAAEYYDLGLEYLSYNNRPYAEKALTAFQNARREVPGYKDTDRLIAEAEALSQLVVLVNPVDYYQFGWNYWGLNNDYLQWQMIQDLNRRSYRRTVFVTEQEARARRLHAERVVDMRFVYLNVSNPHTERRSYTRSQVITPQPRPGTTTRPGSQTVTATVTVTRRYIDGRGDLECRIYDVPTGSNILYDRFPGRYNWVMETATYTGDSRALTDEDWRLINNRFNQVPTRQDVAQKVIEDSYQLLLRRIEQG